MFTRVEIPFIGFEDGEIRRVIECAAFEAGAFVDAPETVRAVTAPAVRAAVARVWVRHYLDALLPEGSIYSKIDRVRLHPSGAITVPLRGDAIACLSGLSGNYAPNRDFLTRLFPARPGRGGVFGFLRDGHIRGELFTEVKRTYVKALKRALRA